MLEGVRKGLLAKQFNMLAVALLTLPVMAFVATAAESAGMTLTLPYRCEMTGGAPHLVPARETSLSILGKHSEQPLLTCRGVDDASCALITVHKFDIACGPTRVAWADVVRHSQLADVTVPPDLPRGYAPISTFGARLVLPAMADVASEPARGAALATTVVREDLSPDGVTQRQPVRDQVVRERQGAQLTAWETVVQSDAAPTVGMASIANSGLWSTLLLLVLLTAATCAAYIFGRDRVSLSVLLSEARADAVRSALQSIGRFVGVCVTRAQTAWQGFVQSADDVAGNSFENLSYLLEARLVEVEAVVAVLPSNVLLRDVLMSELANLRARADDVARRARRTSPDKSAAAFRAILRDLDRIQRIALTSAEQPEPQAAAAFKTAEDVPLPRTMAEAYRILGLNADAPPQAAKKLVDALRMTWHPDLARDDKDRWFREERMKQINVAWDMVKSQHRPRAAAA